MCAVAHIDHVYILIKLINCPFPGTSQECFVSLPEFLRRVVHVRGGRLRMRGLWRALLLLLGLPGVTWLPACVCERLMSWLNLNKNFTKPEVTLLNKP